jgi:hypothetical protein
MTKSRGPNFSAIEDILICKAYIASSEDPIVGNKSGLAEFGVKFAENYRVLLLAHIDRERLLSKNKGEAPDETKFCFAKRNGPGLWRRYKLISHDCLKFYGIEKMNEAKSGENLEMVHERHMEIWKMRNNGKSFRYWPCAEYLREKQKWRSVLLKETDKKTDESVATIKIKRPSGKKKATKDKEHRELVHSIAKSVISVGDRRTD